MRRLTFAPLLKWGVYSVLPIVLGLALWRLNQHRLNLALLATASEPAPGQIAELIAKGANVNSQNFHGDTPLHEAAFATTKDNSDTIKQLVAHGANIDAANVDGDHPLHYAIAFGNISSVRALVQAGADVNARSKRFGVPLSQASTALRQERNSYPQSRSNGSLLQMMSLLKSRGAKTNQEIHNKF